MSKVSFLCFTSSVRKLIDCPSYVMPKRHSTVNIEDENNIYIYIYIYIYIKKTNQQMDFGGCNFIVLWSPI